jgi:hypothetical protein
VTHQQLMTRRSRRCPTCQTTGILVLFGMPTSEVGPVVGQRLLAHRGCIVHIDRRI